MGTNLGNAYVQIIPSAKGMKEKLSAVMNKEMPGAGSSAGSSFGSGLVSKLKAVIAAAGIGKMLSTAINEGAALEQSIGGIETLFKDSADTIKKYAAQAYQTAGLSANAYMETVTSFSASLLQSLGGDTAKAAETANMALIDMSDNANKMGTDMESIQLAYQGFAKQNYTMLDNLKLGYGGTKTEMQRLLADAQKLTGVEYDMDSLDDVYNAIHAIQVEMGISGLTAEQAAEAVKSGAMTEAEALEAMGTTAKEASTTVTGSLNAMKAAATNVLGNLALGADIGPSLTALADTTFTFLTDNLLPMVGNILSSLPSVLDSAFSAAIRGLDLIGDNAPAILQQGIELVVGLGKSIVTALPYLAEAAVKVGASLGRAILDTDWIALGNDIISELGASLDTAAKEIFGTDGDLIGSLLAAIETELPKLLDTGADIVLELASGILDAVPQLLDGAKTLLGEFTATISNLLPGVLATGTTVVLELVAGIQEALPDIVKGAGELAAQFLSTILDILPQILDAGVDLVLELIGGINLPDLAGSVFSLISTMLKTLAEHLPDFLAKGIELVGKLVAGLIEAIPKVVAAIPKIVSRAKEEFLAFDWLGLGKDMIAGIAKGITSAAGAIVTAAKKAAENALNSVKKFLGIASPSKVMRDEVGKFIPAGIAVGIEGNTKPLTDAMDELSDLAVDTVVSADLAGMAARSVAAEGLSLPQLPEIASGQTQPATSLEERLDALYGLLELFLPELLERRIVLDTGATVGALAPAMNTALGKISERSERWR